MKSGKGVETKKDLLIKTYAAYERVSSCPVDWARKQRFSKAQRQQLVGMIGMAYLQLPSGLEKDKKRIATLDGVDWLMRGRESGVVSMESFYLRAGDGVSVMLNGPNSRYNDEQGQSIYLQSCVDLFLWAGSVVRSDTSIIGGQRRLYSYPWREVCLWVKKVKSGS